MEPSKNSNNVTPWTWADQISSYQFWGLFLFYILSLLPNSILSFHGSIFGNDIYGATLGNAFDLKNTSMFGGFLLAWLLVRLNNHYLLYLYSSLTIIGLLLIYFVPSSSTVLVSAMLFGLSTGAIFLAIASIISGGRGGSLMLLVSLGIMQTYEMIIWKISGYVVAMITSVGDYWDRSLPTQPYNILILTSLILFIIGTLALIPVKPTLFNVAPPKREFSYVPEYRNPVSVAILGLIPFYGLYLLYYYHYEINYIQPSNKILSPSASVWGIIFIPFLAPIITSSLNEVLIDKLSEKSSISYYKDWTIILWTLLFFPISLALIQSNMNQYILHKKDFQISNTENN